MTRPENIHTLLGACPFLAGAGSADIEALAAIATAVSWPPGTLLFQRGDPSDFLIVVAAGRIRLGLNSSSGRELTLRHAGAGSVIGEMGVLDNHSRSADATAAVQSRGLVIRRGPFEHLLAERPGLARAVITFLVTRLRDTTYQLESVALYDLGARLARFLLAALHQSHGAELPQQAILGLDLGQSDIAAILGASRPKVNRAYVDLLKCGAIKRLANGLDCDVQQLMTIAGDSEA